MYQPGVRDLTQRLPPNPTPTRTNTHIKYNSPPKRLLFKIRLHLGPYLVAHADKQGKGFGFLQSTSTLEELYLIRPMGPRGQPLERAVVVHYLTMYVC